MTFQWVLSVCCSAQGWHLSALWLRLTKAASRHFSFRQGCHVSHQLCLPCSRADLCLWIHSPSPYLHFIDSSFAIRGSYVKCERPWLEINHMKRSARESDYGVRRGWEKITIPPREGVDGIVAIPLSVCLLSRRLVCLFWLSSSLPINCVTFPPRPRASERGEAFFFFFLSINI